MAEKIIALGARRLSRRTDESTSIERQTETLERWAAATGAELILAEPDVDVSGAVSPFERAGIGPWLDAAPPRPWDVLVAWKLDRVSRSALDTLTLVEWLNAAGKRLVCVADSLDTGTTMGAMFVKLAAIFAEMERAAIKERTADSRAKLRAAGRWPGGQPPFGYKPEKLDAGGWRLAVRDEQAAVLHRAAGRLLAGASFSQIGRELTADGVPTPRQGQGWPGNVVRMVVTNPTVLWGVATHNGGTLDSVAYADPIFDVTTAAKIAAAAKAREMNRAPGRGGTKWLTGIVVCGACGNNLYHMPGSRPTARDTYRCRGKTHKRICTMPNVYAEELEPFVEREFLARHGREELLRREVTPGADNTPELDAVRKRAADLAGLIARGLVDGQDADVVASLEALARRRAELEAAPVVPDAVTLVPTGLIVLDAWEEGTDDGRRQMLLDWGATVTVARNDGPSGRLAYSDTAATEPATDAT